MSMDNTSSDDRLRELLTLHGQILRLLKEIERLPVENRGTANRRLAREYNRLRGQVIRLAGDPGRATLAPKRVWCPTGELIVAAMFSFYLVVMGIFDPFSTNPIIPSDRMVRLFTLLLIWIGLLLVESIGLAWVRRGRGTFAATTNKIHGQAELLLAYFRENIKEVDLALEAQLPDITTIQERTEVVPTNAPEQPAQVHKLPKKPSVPVTGKPRQLTESDRRHLAIQLREQQTRYDQLTARIAAVTADLGRETDSERELILKDRLEKLIDEREQVQTSLKTIERELDDGRVSV
jgi:hypothetical protein